MRLPRRMRPGVAARIRPGWPHGCGPTENLLPRHHHPHHPRQRHNAQRSKRPRPPSTGRRGGRNSSLTAASPTSPDGTTTLPGYTRLDYADQPLTRWSAAHLLTALDLAVRAAAGPPTKPPKRCCKSPPTRPPEAPPDSPKPDPSGTSQPQPPAALRRSTPQHSKANSTPSTANASSSSRSPANNYRRKPTRHTRQRHQAGHRAVDRQLAARFSGRMAGFLSCPNACLELNVCAQRRSTRVGLGVIEGVEEQHHRSGAGSPNPDRLCARFVPDAKARIWHTIWHEREPPSVAVTDRREATMSITEEHPYGRPVWTDKLALRPNVFSETAHHPDPSPCPAWCVEAIDGDVHPLTIYGEAGGDVLHDGEIVTSRASLYPRPLGARRSSRPSPPTWSATVAGTRSTSADVRGPTPDPRPTTSRTWSSSRWKMPASSPRCSLTWPTWRRAADTPPH